MEILKDINEIARISQPLSIALGNFDGVHLGHQLLVKKCVEESRASCRIPCVFTLDPHPALLLGRERNFKMLNAVEYKIKALSEMGIEILVMLAFNKELADKTPSEFINEYLLKPKMIRKLYVGFNYTFGREGKGTPELLIQAGKEKGFEVYVLPPIVIDGQVVSSSLVKRKYSEGDMPGAAKLLGYRPFLEGHVVSGEKRGRVLGYPTANICVREDLMLPAFGVYAAKVQIFRGNGPGREQLREQLYNTVVNIGRKPTFGTNAATIEAHIIDMHCDLYGKQLRVFLHQKIRDEAFFKQAEELKAQIEKDIIKAKKILGEDLAVY